jgi:prophage regulatory protein|tara:strand:- start:290 stop:499 length:210 start_codon:yes stop_codon:yes gene_type:complete
MKSRSKLLKVGEVSEWLNVSRSTIYKWVHEGEFPEPVVLGQDDGKRSASRWKEDEVVDWLESRPRGVQE